MSTFDVESWERMADVSCFSIILKWNCSAAERQMASNNVIHVYCANIVLYITDYPVADPGGPIRPCPHLKFLSPLALPSNSKIEPTTLVYSRYSKKLSLILVQSKFGNDV
jgi:hypothetical protein